MEGITPENIASSSATSSRRRHLNPLEDEDDRDYINQILFEEDEMADDVSLFEEDMGSEDVSEYSDSSDLESQGDAENGGVRDSNTAQPGGSTHERSDWNWDIPSAANYDPVSFTFDTASAGIQPNCPITEESKEMDYFLLYFDEDLVQYIVDETNRYHRCKVRDGVVSENARRQWKDVSVSEMYSFLALAMNMPLVYKGDIKDYWSTNPLIKTEIFSKVMSRDRYLSLLRTLHFANNAENIRGDSLFRIRYVSKT